MSVKSFDAGDVGLFAIGFLNKIYDESRKQIEKRKAFKGLDYFYLSEVVDATWDEIWNSPDGMIINQAINNGMILPHQAENVKNSKSYILSALLPYIVTAETAVVTDREDEDSSLPICNGYYWTLMKRQLLEKFPAPVVESIDRQSSRVLKQILFTPEETKFRKMGLVLGQVQSGKTANYSALIAKACDEGYKLIIVLSGIHNDLRQQTQERLDEEFLGYHEYMKTEDEETGRLEQTTRSIPCGVGFDPEYDASKAPESATFTDDDFRGILKTGAGKKPPVIFVIKKQTNVFQKIKRYFSDPSNAHRYKDWPLLVIDDEADQASVNTRKGDLVTATNRHIRTLLQLFPRATFVGYTATPFANVLIDADANHKKLGVDLFPKDFILSLPAPINYFGPRQFFGDNQEDVGLELFMPISERSSDILTGNVRMGEDGQIRERGRGRRRKALDIDELPLECDDVLRQFILSSAIRLWRLKTSHPELWCTDLDETPKEPILEMSSLVHVSSYVRDQQVIARLFAKKFEEMFREPLLYGNREDRELVLSGFESLFDNQKRVTARTAENRAKLDAHPDWRLPETLTELVPEIQTVVADMWLRVVNGDKAMTDLVSPDHEDLDRSYCCPVIFIGGNKLSRGLTLPGLCVSLFLRSSTMYDTLLQMGRWFGYRDGYVDLCRICTTTHIIDRFRAISEACIDFEQQIDRMASINRNPKNYRLSMLSHTGLQVTARNKMAHADEGRVNFNGDILECRDLSITTDDLVHNWGVAKHLYDYIKEHAELAYASKGYPEHQEQQVACFIEGKHYPSGRLWKNVPADRVLDFLESYRSNKDAGDVYRRGVTDYIKKVLNNDELTNWNVFIPGESDPENGSFKSKFIKRTMQIGNVDPTSALLPTLKAGSHEFIGVPEEVINVADKSAGTKRGDRFREVRRVAGELHPETGYLILYLMRPHADELTNDSYVKNAESQIGERVPFVSFYVWLPKTAHETQTSIAVFNKTVVHQEDDEWDEEAPEMEEDEE